MCPLCHRSLAEVADFYWNALTTAQRCALRRGLAGRTWTVGTACSGSDSVVHVLERLGRPCGYSFMHLFSCENDPDKQAWVREHWPGLPQLFSDICQLHTGRCLNVLAGLEEDVPAVDIFIAGFVCKSLSSENNQRAAHADCISAGTGKTGSTFEGLRRYVQRVRPKIVICENVVGLLKRNRGERPQIADVGEAFQRLRYHFDYKQVDARNYLLPHRRTRVWMWAVREDISAALAAQRVRCVLEQLEQPEPAPLRTFLDVSATLAAQHVLPRQDLNLREAQALSDVLSSPSVQDLAKESLDALIVDVSKSAGRAPWCVGAAPCALPGSRLFWRHRQCVLTPREVAALQGIWAADFRFLADWCADKHRARVVADMAGNAFTSTVCMAVCLAVLATISR